jgi:hypothetical protein
MDVLTQHNDNFRTGSVRIAGLNSNSPTLKRWTLLTELPVDAAVWAQPLYVEQLRTSDGAIRDIALIATANNTVYAYDVHSYQLVWQAHLGEPDRSDQQPPYKGNPCASLSPGRELTRDGQLSFRPAIDGKDDFFIGIQATPVIDRGRMMMYVSYRVGGTIAAAAEQRLAAIHLENGAVAKDVAAAVDPGFHIEAQRQRAAILLSDQMLFLAFASRCEELPAGYHGWVFAYDIETLTQLTHINLTPTSQGAGIWQGAGGLAADDLGRVYLISGNLKGAPDPDPTGRNLGNSFVRLDPEVVRRANFTVASATLSVGSWFTPYRARWQNDIDLDLGSAGPVLIPDTNLVAGGGKEGVVYLLDRNDLGGFTAPPANALPPKCQRPDKQGKLHLEYCAAFIPNDSHRDGALSEVTAGENSYVSFQGQDMNDWTWWPHIHGSPVYGDFGDKGRFLYVWPEKDYLKAISLTNQNLAIAKRGPDRAPPGIKTADGWVLGGMPGGMLALAIDANDSEKGVLFASVPIESFPDLPRQTQLHGALYAYDPITLKRVWTSRETDDKSYFFAKFVGPTITPAALLLPTFSSKVLLYGRLRLGGGQLAGIARNPGQEDIFCVGTNGVVYTNYEVNDGAWHGWIPLIDYSDAFPDHFTVPASATLAVVKRNDRQEDLFVVGRDGKAYTCFELDGGVWSNWISLGASAAGFPPGAALTATMRNERQEDLFVVGRDGNAYTCFELDDGAWSNWISLGAPAAGLPPGASLAAVKRNDRQEDLFAVGNDGSAYACFELDDGAWSNWIEL